VDIRFNRAGSNDVLDRTAEIQAQKKAEAERSGRDAARPAPRRFAAPRRLGGSVWHFFVAQSFSSLTRRIVFLNLTGLIVLLAGVLYLSQFRAGLIDARVQSLLVQSEIIAGAIAASATVETDSITIDPTACSNCRPARATARPTISFPA